MTRLPAPPSLRSPWLAAALCAVFTLSASCEESSSGRRDAGPEGDSRSDGLLPASDIGPRPDGDGSLSDGSLSDGGRSWPADDRLWTHAGVSSALIYWTAGPLNDEAQSYVRYGQSSAYDQQTPPTSTARWAQLHRITGLQPNTTYHFQRVLVTADGERQSADATLTTTANPEAIRIPDDVAGPPYVLDQHGALYLLTADVTAPGTAIEITGSDITLELDGHSVTFGTGSTEQVFGVYVHQSAPATVQNGHVRQGDAAGPFSSGVETRWRAAPLEIFGITTEIHRPDGFALRLFGSAQDVKLHHNHLKTTVRAIESRHTGNDILRINASGPNIHVHDNLLSDGPHVGLRVSGEGANLEVAYNDIRHDALFTNGYALALSAEGGLFVHHNRVTSVARGAHLTDSDIEFADNYLDLRGHMTRSDMPAGSGNWQDELIELHGIKLEGSGVKNARVHGNYTRIVQPLPDDSWTYVPATPLNVACYDPNANNEIYDNTFIGLTEYSQTRHGPYGDSGQWATGIYFVEMNKGEATPGSYSAYIHNNTFISNDLFVAATGAVNMTVRIEQNTFTLATDPPPTETHAPFYRLGDALEAAIRAGNNTFQGMTP